MNYLSLELPEKFNGELEMRPCLITPCEDIEECSAENAKFWGVYGGTEAGPKMHIEDFPTQEAAADAIAYLSCLH